MSKHILLNHCQILVSVLKEFLKELFGFFLCHRKMIFFQRRFCQTADFFSLGKKKNSWADTNSSRFEQMRDQLLDQQLSGRNWFTSRLSRGRSLWSKLPTSTLHRISPWLPLCGSKLIIIIINCYFMSFTSLTVMLQMYVQQHSAKSTRCPRCGVAWRLAGGLGSAHLIGGLCGAEGLKPPAFLPTPAFWSDPQANYNLDLAGHCGGVLGTAPSRGRSKSSIDSRGLRCCVCSLGLSLSSVGSSTATGRTAASHTGFRAGGGGGRQPAGEAVVRPALGVLLLWRVFKHLGSLKLPTVLPLRWRWADLETKWLVSADGFCTRQGRKNNPQHFITVWPINFSVGGNCRELWETRG